MKDRASKKPNESKPQAKRRGVLEHLLNVAEFVLKRSSDSEEQSEALECKKLLEGRLRDLEKETALAA